MQRPHPRSVVFAVVASFILFAPSVAFAEHGGCPSWLKQRTPLQVYTQHIAAISAGDIDRAMCDFADDAVVVMPGTVLEGRDAIRAGLIAFGSMMGGAIPTVTSVTQGDELVLLTWTLTTPTVSVPDGSDTYVIRKGRIQAQSVHASVVLASVAP